jgi:hypothetical protein
MTEHLVLGDSASLPAKLSGRKPDLHLVTIGKKRNLRVQADVFRSQLWREISDRLDDLLRLAAFVYGADTRISRGTAKDVFASAWRRSFRMVLPVWDLSFWKQRDVHDALAEKRSSLAAFKVAARESVPPEKRTTTLTDISSVHQYSTCTRDS